MNTKHDQPQREDERFNLVGCFMGVLGYGLAILILATALVAVAWLLAGWRP